MDGRAEPHGHLTPEERSPGTPQERPRRDVPLGPGPPEEGPLGSDTLGDPLAGGEASRGPGTVLATPNSRRLLGSRLAGQWADGVLQAALGGFVLFSPERQATPAQVAGAFALLLLPYSLIGPFAGVLLDRWSRARVLVVANLARAGVMLLVALMVAAERDGLDLGVVVLVALGLGRLVLAGLSAGLPHVVAAEDLVIANALFPTAGTIASAIGTVSGLVLVPRLGPQGPTILVLAVACGLLLAALIAGRIPRDDLGPDADDPARTRRLTADLVEVVRGLVAAVGQVHRIPVARRALGIVVTHRFVFGLLLVDALLIVRTTLNGPDQAEAALGDFALIAAGASAGSFLAAMTTPVMARVLGVSRWAALTVLVAAVAAPLAFAALTLPALVLGSTAMGFSGQAVKIAGDTTLQQAVRDDFRGRVFAVYDVALNVALVSGIAVTAFTVPSSGISVPLWVAASGLLLATAAWGLRHSAPSG